MYGIRIANHTTMVTSMHPQLFDSLHQLQQSLVALARMALLNGDNVTFTTCHIKMLESFHNSNDGWLSPSSPQ